MPSFDLPALQIWLKPFGVELSAQQLHQTRVFLDTLLLWNRRFNLVSQARADEIIIKHLADSFVIASLLAGDERIADLGSGGGFPAIPIAIARASSSLFLIEGNQKKASFLSEVAAQCRLPLVRIVNDRIEAVCQRRDFAHTFSVVTARALWKLSDLLAVASLLLAPGGRLLAMKGPGYTQELPQGEQGFAMANLFEYELPDGAERKVLDLRFT